MPNSNHSGGISWTKNENQEIEHRLKSARYANCTFINPVKRELSDNIRCLSEATGAYLLVIEWNNQREKNEPTYTERGI